MQNLPIAVVSVSGGKDSMDTAGEAIDTYGKDRVILVHAFTGHEHELTDAYVANDIPKMTGLPVHVVKADFAKDIERKRRYVTEKWPGKGVTADIIANALEVLKPTGVPFLDLCIMKGRFPSRMAQFCTQELKRYPLDAFMFDLMAKGLTVESWQGVRRDESQTRKGALDSEMTPEGWMIRRPIAGKTAEQVIASVLARGWWLNPLYALGCTRVGCMLCINAGKDEIANCARRWPHHVDRIRAWELIVSEASKWGFATFFCAEQPSQFDTPEDIFAAWNVDRRIEWAMTSRGGKQYDWLRSVAEPTACSSSYGLCE